MKRRLPVAVLLGLALAAPPAHAQQTGTWTNHGPSTGKSALAVATHPSGEGPVFASLIPGTGVPHGVYRSLDRGETWEPAVAGLPTPFHPQSFAFHPDDPLTAYAAAGTVYKTVDGGGSWFAANEGIPSGFVNAVVTDPGDGARAWVANAGGVHRTTDGGASWTASNDNLPAGGARALVYAPGDPQRMYVSIYDGSSAPPWRVYRSDDAGASWSPTTLALDVFIYTQTVAPEDPSTVFTGIEGGIHRSTDGGSSWTDVSSGLPGTPVRTILVDPADASRVLAGTDAGVYLSTNGGGSWQPAPGLPGELRGYQLSMTREGEPTTYLGACCNRGSVWRSDDRGATWSTSTTGFPADTSLRPVVAAPSDPTVVYTGAYGGAQLYRSDDRGVRWKVRSLPPGADVSSLAVHPTDPDIVIAGTYRAGLHRSTDGGDTWTSPTLLPGTQIEAVAFSPSDPQVAFAGGIVNNISTGLFPVVYRTTDGGATWTPSSIGFPAYGVVLDVAVDPVDPDLVYAAAGWYGMFKSIDGGATWVSISAGLAWYSVNGVAADPVNPGTVYASVFGVSQAGGGVYKSTTGGLAWLPTGLVGVSTTTVVIDPTNPQRLYAAVPTDGRIVVTSGDGGASWTAVSDGLDSSRRPYKLAIADDGSHVYGATQGSGVFVLTPGSGG